MWVCSCCVRYSTVSWCVSVLQRSHRVYCVRLAQLLVDDYCSMVPGSVSTLQNIHSASPRFCCQFITAVTTLYDLSSGNLLGWRKRQKTIIVASTFFPVWIFLDLSVGFFRGADSPHRASPDDRVLDPRRPASRPHHLPEHAPVRQPANQLAGCHAIGRAGALVRQSPAGLQARQKAGLAQRHQ